MSPGPRRTMRSQINLPYLPKGLQKPATKPEQGPAYVSQQFLQEMAQGMDQTLLAANLLGEKNITGRAGPDCDESPSNPTEATVTEGSQPTCPVESEQDEEIELVPGPGFFENGEMVPASLYRDADASEPAEVEANDKLQAGLLLGTSKALSELILAVADHPDICSCSACVCLSGWSDEDEARALEAEASGHTGTTPAPDMLK